MNTHKQNKLMKLDCCRLFAWHWKQFTLKLTSPNQESKHTLRRKATHKFDKRKGKGPIVDSFFFSMSYQKRVFIHSNYCKCQILINSYCLLNMWYLVLFLEFLVKLITWQQQELIHVNSLITFWLLISLFLLFFWLPQN